MKVWPPGSTATPMHIPRDGFPHLTVLGSGPFARARRHLHTYHCGNHRFNDFQRLTEAGVPAAWPGAPETRVTQKGVAASNSRAFQTVKDGAEMTGYGFRVDSRRTIILQLKANGAGDAIFYGTTEQYVYATLRVDPSSSPNLELTHESAFGKFSETFFTLDIAAPGSGFKTVALTFSYTGTPPNQLTTVRAFVDGRYVSQYSETVPRGLSNLFGGAIYGTSTGEPIVPIFLVFNDVLTDGEILRIGNNPERVLAPLVSMPFSVQLASVTVYRPGSDVTTTGWTGVPDNTNLYTNLDEVTATDSDYVESPTVDLSTPAATFGLTASPPAGTWAVDVRATRTIGAAQLRVLLLDGSGAVVGTSSWQSLAGTFTTHTFHVTTSATAARVRVEVQP